MPPVAHAAVFIRDETAAQIVQRGDRYSQTINGDIGCLRKMLPNHMVLRDFLLYCRTRENRVVPVMPYGYAENGLCCRLIPAWKRVSSSDRLEGCRDIPSVKYFKDSFV